MSVAFYFCQEIYCIVKNRMYEILQLSISENLFKETFEITNKCAY